MRRIRALFTARYAENIAPNRRTTDSYAFEFFVSSAAGSEMIPKPSRRSVSNPADVIAARGLQDQLHFGLSDGQLAEAARMLDLEDV